jgi:diaminopimelate decarboxylase
MQKVLRLGVPQSQILYAGPYRPSAQLQFAVQRGVELLTFESEAELRKLNSKHCSAK